MAFILAENINRKSPYQVTQVDELSVRFVTDNGVRYVVGFTKDIFILDDNGYFFYIICESEPKKQDAKVLQTVICVMEDLFFNAKDSATMYICASEDGRQNTRARLFRTWFASTAMSEEYTLATYESVDDDQGYYYGLILRKDNPAHDRLVQSFLDFLKDY